MRALDARAGRAVIDVEPNGGDEYAALRARVAACEAAITALARRLEEDWRPRLLAIERDLDQLLELLEAAARDDNP